MTRDELLNEIVALQNQADHLNQQLIALKQWIKQNQDELNCPHYGRMYAGKKEGIEYWKCNKCEDMIRTYSDHDGC